MKQKYKYEGLDRLGQMKRGFIEALNEERAYINLRQQGLFVTSLSCVSGRFEDDESIKRNKPRSMAENYVVAAENRKNCEIAAKVAAHKKEMMEWGEERNTEIIHNAIMDVIEEDEENRFTNPSKSGKLHFGELHMDEIKKKAIIDLLAAPITIIPLVGGISSLILSWVAGSSLLALGGIVGIVVGGAIFSSRLIFGLEEITKNAYERLQEQRKKETEESLDQLDQLLRQDKDARPEQCLRELRLLYDLLKDESKNNIACGDDILKNFEQMFEACVQRIKKSDDLWRASRNIHNSAKKKLLEERENIVDEVVQVTEHLSSVVRQTKEIKQTKEKSELSELQKELEKTLTVARRTEERISKLDSPNYDVKEFET